MKNHGMSQNGNKRLFLQYSVLFCVFAAGIFFALIIFQRTFMQFQDAYTQGVFRLIELRNQARSILGGDGFSFWSWYEGPGTDEPLENFIEIGSLIGALFPERYVELGLTVAALVRMYLGGAAFLLLGRENGLSDSQDLIGSILYTFSACFIGMAIRQSEMLVNAYLFPLLILTADRIYRKRSAVPFILTVAYYMAVAVYNAYMSAIVIVMYILIRYLHYNDKTEPREYALNAGRFALYGITGILISAGTSLFSIATIGRASADSSLEPVGILFDAHQYAVFGKMILGSGATYDYLDIGIPVAVLLLLPVAISKVTRKKTNVIMFITLFVMMLIPFFSSMFNGFGYVTFRWSYTLLLFAVWSGVEQYDAEVFRDRKNLRLSLIGLLLIGAWAVGPYLGGETSIGMSGKFFCAVQLAAGAALLLIFRRAGKAGEISRKTTAAVLLISLMSLSLGWSAGFYGNRNNFAEVGTVQKNLSTSTFRVSNQIDDDGFYRIDSVDGMNRHAMLKFPANENIWWKSNNLFIYNSRIPETLTDFNVSLGNSYGYARRVYMLSNGNRMGLDFIYGVRYFLGSDAKKKGYEDSDNYAGYGFEKTGTIDGVNVFKNKYDTGLGFVYQKAIPEKEFAGLDSLYKEQALMQAAVIPEEEMSDIGDTELVSAGDLEYDIKDLDYEVTGTDGLTIGDDVIEAEKGNASFTISAADIPDCQLIVSFDGLLRDSKDDKTGSSYEIYASDGKVTREAIALKSRQGVGNLVNHDLNMGHHSGDAAVTVTFERKGTYTFDGIHLYAMSTALYDKYASERMESSLKVTEYSDKKVAGTVETDKDGVLFLSIPVHESWDIYVDGVKTEPVENVNITFKGVFVPAGGHEIELVYNNRYVKLGCLLTLLGLVITAFIIRREKRSGDRQSVR